MKLRSLPIHAMLAAGLVVAVVPSYGLGRRGDTPSQQSQNSSNPLPYPGKVVEQIIARVDDQVIDTSDYARAKKEVEQDAKRQNWSPEELARQKKNLLRSLIDKQLLLAKGKQLGISGEDELIHRLDEIRKQNQLKSMQALQQAVEAQGLSWQDFKQQIRQQIIQQRVIQQKVMPNIRINPEEVQAYYEQHKSEYKHPEQVRLSEILISTPNPDDAAQVAQAKAKVDSIEKQLKGGADFAKLAKKDSNGPRANQGGDLGVFEKGQLAPMLEKATFSLKAGQYTEPIQTRQGWIILEVTKHENAGVAPLNQVQNQIMETIGMAKMPAALRKYLSKLRNEAYIDIRPGYTDTGATANEVKPTYSAYKPPKEKIKKKPHFRRKRFVSKRELAKRERKEKTRTEKLGKREKIRYGQAPREALPPALNQTDLNNESGQMAANSEPEASASSQSSEIKKPRKVRYSSLARKRKREKKKEKEKEKKVNPHFPAPVVGKLNKATQEEQESSLGLGGVTKKKKKAHPMREGPKRRYTNVQEKKEKKQKEKQKASSTSSDSGTGSSNTQQ